MILPPPRSTLFPYTTLFRSDQRRESATISMDELPEGPTRHVDPLPLSDDEHHRHVERIGGIFGVSRAGLQGELEQPRAVRVRVQPDMRAFGKKHVSLTPAKRRGRTTRLR